MESLVSKYGTKTFLPVYNVKVDILYISYLMRLNIKNITIRFTMIKNVAETPGILQIKSGVVVSFDA